MDGKSLLLDRLLQKAFRFPAEVIKGDYLIDTSIRNAVHRVW